MRLPDFIINAFVPDEIWHTDVMQGSLKNVSYLSVPNYQAHGSAFWWFGALMERCFGDIATFYILRIFSLFSLLGTAFLVVFSFRSSFKKHELTVLFFTLFTLTLPLFWWDGKLIFPEFFQCFLIALAYYFIYVRKKNIILGFFSLGFCFGLKLHAGAVIAFFLADNLITEFHKEYLLHFQD